MNFHDNDLVPIDATAAERDRIVRDFRAGARRPPASPCRWRRPTCSPIRCSRTARSRRTTPGCARYAVQKTMRAMDLGVELGARTYVFWGGREGAEVDAGKDPIEAIKRFRDAIDFLCEYARDQRYDLRFALEAKPNEPRGDIYFPTTAAYLGFIGTLAHPGDGRRQPGVRARADGRPELLPRRRAGARGRQAVSHRPQRSEAGPLRSGPALRVGVDQAALLPGQAARGAGLRRPAPLRRARLPDRGRRRRVGLRARLHAHLPDPEGQGAAPSRRTTSIQALLAEIRGDGGELEPHSRDGARAR